MFYNKIIGQGTRWWNQLMLWHLKEALREGNNSKSDNFEMDILDEGALDKALEGPEKL